MKVKGWLNYNIFNKQSTALKFYTIPTVVDINSPYRVKLNLAEGPLDILSVYLNMRNREPGIYTAITGNNYLNVIYHFM